jgi:hypothetical protein
MFVRWICGCEDLGVASARLANANTLWLRYGPIRSAEKTKMRIEDPASVIIVWTAF